jgi:hypothetical protein
MIVTASSVAVNNPAALVGQHTSSVENSTVPKVHECRTRKPRRPNSATALEQAIALHDSLRRQVGHASELIRVIKLQHCDLQLVKSTLASLKQFQATG